MKKTLKILEMGMLVVVMISAVGCKLKTIERVATAIEMGIEGKGILDDYNQTTAYDDIMISHVKEGILEICPTITVGEAFDKFFREPKWRYFEGDNGELVVEFTGYCRYQEVEVLARQQFLIIGAYFEIGALRFNEVPQNSMIQQGLLTKIYEEENKRVDNLTRQQLTGILEENPARIQPENEDVVVQEEPIIKEDKLYMDFGFTEEVIGFDIKSFSEMTFASDQKLESFLNEYGFQIVSGDLGAFYAVDELETQLYVNTNGIYGEPITIEYVEAEVPNYNIYLDEVKQICGVIEGEKMIYDEETCLSYYSAVLDSVQVNYEFTYDSLREENAKAARITIKMIQ